MYPMAFHSRRTTTLTDSHGCAWTLAGIQTSTSTGSAGKALPGTVSVQVPKTSTPDRILLRSFSVRKCTRRQVVIERSSK